MKIDRRITGGLAWAGLVVILAVPSVDILFGKPTVQASITSDMSAVRADSATPVAPAEPAGQANASASAIPATQTDPVQTASIAAPAAASQPAGEAATPPAAAPTQPQLASVTQPAASQPATTEQSAQVATTQPAEDPPIPMPRNMRPLPDQISVATAAPAQPASDQPLIIDESRPRQDQVASDASPDFFGPSNGSSQQMIGQDRLEAWNSGSLADYLQRNGLLDQGTAPEPQVDDTYDPDGFFLSDGPNDQPRRRYWRDDQSWFF